VGSSFLDFSHRKRAAAVAARIAPLETVADRSIAFPLEPTGSPWSAGLYDGLFHLWRVEGGGGPAVSLVFVQSRDGNTAADDPGELGGGDTDKHFLYEGLTRVAADAVLSGAATASGPDVFFSIWHPRLVALRLEIGLPRHPAQVVVTRRGRIDVERSLLLNVPDVPVFVLCSSAARSALAPSLRSRPWVALIPLDAAGLRGALVALRRDHGINRISAVGGRTTATTLVDEGLVQDLYLTTGARPGGFPHTPWYAGHHPPALDRMVVTRGPAPDGEILFEHLALLG
jgi:riboflavin biosynthesis pyrimidine reductase